MTADDPEVAGDRDSATVAVVIPSWHGEVARTLWSLEAQTYRRFAVEVVRRVSPAARARNRGVAVTGGEYILFLDDDAYLGHPAVLEQLVAALDADEGVGIAGPSKVLPADANWLQRRIAVEVPRWVFPVLDHATESNPPLDRYGFTGITTSCCLVRRGVFAAVGGFDERLPTGPEDTEFFFRVRQAGHRFVIPAHCRVDHAPPRHLLALLRKSFRYGAGHAHEARLSPGRGMALVPLDRWYGMAFVVLSPLLFIPSLFVAYYFDPVRRWHVGFRPFKAMSTYATLYGYTWGWFRDAT